MKLFKKTYRLYFILTILGIVCIGLQLWQPVPLKTRKSVV